MGGDRWEYSGVMDGVTWLGGCSSFITDVAPVCPTSGRSDDGMGTAAATREKRGNGANVRIGSGS